MRRSSAAVAVFAAFIVTGLPIHAQGTPPGCDADNAGLKLPPGFCAGVFASGIPAARHIAVAGNGDVFVISDRGRARGAGPQRGMYRLRDANHDGKADSTERVADGTGTGIAISGEFLYAEAGGATIVRYPFRPGTTDLTGAVNTIVTGLPSNGNHTQRNFVIRGASLFVNVGTATNSCQSRDRQPNIPGVDPCVELETRGGIWQFDANQKNQAFDASHRFATGIRNSVSLTLNAGDNELYVVQHGRDQLADSWGRSPEYSAENPGEELFHVVKGGDYGWPYCYYSTEEKKKVLAPEYGGDGKQVGRCAGKVAPLYAFPGHWAPDGSLFYTRSQFPAEYRDGIFVAFHGSWNRAPLPQAGYNITFLPMKGGKAVGAHRVFADGFNAMLTTTPPPGAQMHRPVGIAQGTDGSIFVSDDAGGSVYRIIYVGR